MFTDVETTTSTVGEHLNLFFFFTSPTEFQPQIFSVYIPGKLATDYWYDILYQ